MNFNTAIETHIFRDIDFLIKRDDLIDEKINGNKAYKFYFLFDTQYKHIVSYGGNQSNAMLTMAYIANLKNIKFTYFTPHLSKYLQNNQTGNLKLAIQNNINLMYSNNPKAESALYAQKYNALFIPQGGALHQASIGLAKLAEHILNLNLSNLCIFYSSGSGSSALFLSKFLKQHNIDVFTTNCVGSKDYLIEQFLNLEKNNNLHPKIITTNKKFSFAKPKIELLKIYNEWIKRGVEFDLLYDCVMWQAISDNIDLFKHYKHRLFIHSGGLSGNETQLKRYEYKKLYNP